MGSFVIARTVVRKHVPIVGNSYRDQTEQDFFQRMQEDPSVAVLSFEAEPNNQYDPNAIKVLAATWGTPRIFAHLGYIPRNMTHIFHEAWQRHLIIEAELVKNSNMMKVSFREATTSDPELSPDIEGRDQYGSLS